MSERNLNILSWNIAGWRAPGRAAVLGRVLAEHNVHVALLQETNLRGSDRIPPCPGYSVLVKPRCVFRDGGEASTGGLAILVRRGIKFEELEKPTLPTGAALELQGVKVLEEAGRRDALELWNVYRPPGRDWRDCALHLGAWPAKPASIFVGDANAHAVTWERHKPPDVVGEELEAWAANHGLTILNDGEPTRIGRGRDGGFSTPDVAIAGPAVAARCTWRVLPPEGSDHYPCLISFQRASKPPPRPPPRFSVKKCDWAKYERCAAMELEGFDPEVGSLEAANTAFAAALNSAFRHCCPFGAVRAAKPWWTSECAKVRGEARRAHSIYRRSGSVEDKTAFEEAEARAQQVYRAERTRAFREFASSLDHRDSEARVWRVLRSMDGRASKSLPDQPLYDAAGRRAISDSEKANLASKHYAKVSHHRIPRHRTKPAILAARKQEQAGTCPESAVPFSRAELDAVLGALHAGAAGADGIRPEMLKKLCFDEREKLRALLNRAWRECRIPSAWRSAIVVPLHKSGKPVGEVRSYRPVALLSVIGKTLESLVRARLEYWARSQELIPLEQAGFSAGRSTDDAILSIVQPAYDGLNEPRADKRLGRPGPARTLIVACDQKAAFDRVSPVLLRGLLARKDCPSHILRFLRCWSADRRYRVRWNESLSKSRVHKVGLAQGSCLSPLCYLLAASELPSKIREEAPTVRTVVFADDITLVCSNPSVRRAAAEMQRALRALERWAEECEVELAPEKTEALLISLDPSESHANAPSLVLGGSRVEYKSNPKLLGVLLDRGITFQAQAKAAASKLKRRSNVIAALAGKSWGPPPSVAKVLYEGFVRPAAMYASGAWMPFLAPTNVQLLETAQNAAARAIVGAPLGSPAVATCREAGLPPLRLLAEREAARLLHHCRRFPDAHPLGCLSRPPDRPVRLRRGGALRTSWRDRATSVLERVLPAGARPLPWPHPADLPPPWEQDRRDHCTFALAGAEHRRCEAPEIRRRAAEEDLKRLRSNFPPAVEIYSDGAARDGCWNGVGGAVLRWPDGREERVRRAAGRVCGSTAAEAAGAAAGLESALAELGPPGGDLRYVFVAFDSRSLWVKLQASWRDLDDPNLRSIASCILGLDDSTRLLFVWLPGHAGIEGNEAADAEAGRGAALSEQDALPTTSAALKSLLRRDLETGWKAAYHAATGEDSEHSCATGGGELLPWKPAWSRADCVLLHRLRLNRHPNLQAVKARWARPDAPLQPTCPHCELEPETAIHAICRCLRWTRDRMECLGTPDPPPSILQSDPEGTIRLWRRRSPQGEPIP